MDRIIRWGLVPCLLVSVYLMWRTLSSGDPEGCGVGDCADVLGSKWGRVLYVPVPLLALIFYSLWLAAEWTEKSRFRGWFVGGALAAATWFVWIMAVVIHSYCIDCLLLHGLGVAVGLICLIGKTSPWKPVGLAFFSVIAFLGVAQIYGPQPQTHRLESRKSVPEAIPEPEISIQSAWEKPGLGLSQDKHPILGNAGSDRVIVVLYDYQCLDCRRVAGYLDDLILNYPEEVCILLVPVPLEGSCNKLIRKGVVGKKGSCSLAKMALAVWRCKPESFEDFHRAVMKDPKISSARALAQEIVGKDDLQKALLGLSSPEFFDRNVELWQELCGTGSKALPKVWLNKQLVLHGAPSSGRIFMAVMKAQLGLK